MFRMLHLILSLSDEFVQRINDTHIVGVHTIFVLEDIMWISSTVV